MFTLETTGLPPWLTSMDATTVIALAAGTVLVIGLVDVLARRLTARAAARARIRAEQWGAHRAAAARRRARLRARTRAVARSFMDTPAARRSMLIVLTITAVAATVLSAHGIQDALTGAGLTAWWARIAGFVAFEGFLLVMAALSWWHRTTGQTGADVYGALVWAGAGVLALVGYHGGGDWIYAVFAPLAALGFHLLTGAERRRRGAGATWFSRIGAAVGARIERVAVWFGRTPTSEETSARERERRRSRVVARAVKAHRTGNATRALRTWLFERALADAEARGLLDEAGRALIVERCAARYSALDALAPAAVAGAALWSISTATAPTPEPEPVTVPTAPPVEPTPEPEPAAPPAVPEPAEPVDEAPLASVQPIRRPKVEDAAASIQALFGGPDEAAAWCATFYDEHGRLPTGREVGDRCGVHQATGRTWIRPVRDALAA